MEIEKVRLAAKKKKNTKERNHTVQNSVFNSILLTGLEFNCAIRDLTRNSKRYESDNKEGLKINIMETVSRSTCT